MNPTGEVGTDSGGEVGTNTEGVEVTHRGDKAGTKNEGEIGPPAEPWTSTLSTSSTTSVQVQKKIITIQITEIYNLHHQCCIIRNRNL